MSLPEPYYQDDHVTIYHGDCREIMPLLPKHDLVITDPPYGMSFRSNHRAVKHKAIEGDESLPLDLIVMADGLATRASYFFCRWDNIKEMDGAFTSMQVDAINAWLETKGLPPVDDSFPFAGILPKPKSVLAWVKNNWSMGDLEHEHGRQWEACLYYPKEGHEFIKRIPDVIYGDRTGNKLHPTQKPVGLLQQLIAANVGETILDPFGGSGTTGLAAKNLGRKCTLIEMELEYCKRAKERLLQEYLPINVPVEAPKQVDMLI